MHKNAKITALIVDDNAHRAAQIAAALRADSVSRVLAAVADLKAAYRTVETQHPDLVIMFSKHLEAVEFPMFAALAVLLRVKAIVLLDRPGTGAQLPPGFIALSAKEIRSIDRLAYFIAQNYAVDQTSTAAGVRRPQTRPNAWKVVVIGASTGGIEALLTVLSAYPKDAPPTLIVQHIGGEYVDGLARRLNRHSGSIVMPAQAGMPLEPGRVLIAPGNSQHLAISSSGARCTLLESDPHLGHRPSVDVLFQSASRLGEKAVGALLTGMGRDGAKGLAAIKAAGGHTIAQNKESSTVFGMPKAAIEIGAAAKQLPIEQIGPAILRAAHLNTRTTDRA